MVRSRLAWGVGVAVGFLLLAWLDTVLAGGPIFHILIGLAMVGTLLEVYALAERHQEEPMRVPPIVLAVVFVALDYAARVGEWGLLGEASARGPLAFWGFYAAMGMAATASLWVLAVAHLLARDPYRWLKGAPATIFGFFYVWFFGAHLFALRGMGGMGMGYVLALLAAAKVGDAGAFFVGSRLGRHKLAPRTSPNKTVEGAIGGLAASVLGTGIIALLFGLEGSVAFWVLFGLVVGVASQFGDLVASAIKRSAGAKDSGHLLPAVGGVLDVVDSPLMAAPVAFWLLAC